MKNNRRIKLAVGSKRARRRFAINRLSKIAEQVYCKFMKIFETELKDQSPLPRVRRLNSLMGQRNEFIPQGSFWKDVPPVDIGGPVDWVTVSKKLLEKNGKLNASV